MKSIPKVIHLCWFSGDEYPELIQRCINSWKRCLPDYKIKIWTYEMAAATGIPFVLEALEERKWAFAADVIRLYALYTEGGVYMDSDVYVKKDFTELLDAEFVTCMEYHPKIVKSSQTDKDNNRKEGVKRVLGISIQAAFLASIPGQPFLKQLLDYYKNTCFILQREPKKLNVDIIAPDIYAQVAEKIGFKYRNVTQHLGGVKIYMAPIIAGGSGEDTDETYAFHCCNGSWRKIFNIRNIKKIIKYILVNIGMRKWLPALEYVRQLDEEAESVNKSLMGGANRRCEDCRIVAMGAPSERRCA